MENKCLITTLQGEMSGQNLPKFGDFIVSADWSGSYDSALLYYGPGTVNGKLDDDFIVTVIEGGTINGDTTVTIPKGTVCQHDSYITITKTNGASKLKLIINNIYTLNGFGFNFGRITNLSVTQSDLVKMVNVNNLGLSNSFSGTINLTELIEGLYSNGWRKSLMSMYCYQDFQYALYDGDTHISTAADGNKVNFNENFTEYTITLDTTHIVIAKRKLIEGVWVSQPTT